MEEYDEIIVTIPVEKSLLKPKRQQLYLDILKGLHDNLIMPSEIRDDKIIFTNKEGFIKYDN